MVSVMGNAKTKGPEEEDEEEKKRVRRKYFRNSIIGSWFKLNCFGVNGFLQKAKRNKI